MAEVTLKIKLDPMIDPSKLEQMKASIKSAVGGANTSVNIVDPGSVTKSIGLIDRVKAAFKSATEAVGETVSKAGLLEKAFAFNVALQTVTAISGAVGTLSQPFVALDTATANMRTLGTEAAAMAPSLRDAAVAMSKDLPFAAAELQTTMFDALASGVQGGEEGLKKFADTSAKLATGGASSIGDATKLLAGNLNAYGKSAEEAAAFSDIFFNTVNFGVTSIPELSAQLSNVIPTAAAAGVELENVGASLAVMTSKGVPTAQATTKLNQLLLEIQKPGATLAPILKQAGVSLESLKRDDLPVTLEKIQKALAATGKTATTAFSSSEASAAFNVLAGGEKSVADFKKTFDDVKNTTGSTQFAFEQMGDSIETKLKGMKAATEALLIQGMDKLGAGFVTIAGGAAQIAPTITTLAGLKNVIPEGMGTRAVAFGRSLLSSVIPSLATTGASAGATGGAFSAMWALATGPVGAVIAGITAVVVATKLIADAVHETAAERLEDSKGSVEALEAQKATVVEQQKQVIQQGNLVNRYRELQASADGTVESQKRLTLAAQQLNIAFPNTVTASADAATNLKNLDKVTADVATQIAKAGADVVDLNKSLSEQSALQIKLEIDVSKEELENQLTDSLDKGFFDSVKGVFTDGFADVGSNINNVLSLGFADEISEFVTGTSGARKAGEELVKGFSDRVYGTTSQTEILKAQAEFAQKIAADGETLGLSKAEQAKAIQGFNEFANKRAGQLKKLAENDKRLSEENAKTISEAFQGMTGTGQSAADAIKLIASQFKITEEKAKSIALDSELKKASAAGKLTEEQIAEIAKKFGVSAEKAHEQLAEQEKQKTAATDTAAAVKSIGDAFAETTKTAKDGFEKNVTELAGIKARLIELKSLPPSDATIKEIEDLKKKRKEIDETGRAQNKQIKTAAELTKEAREELGDKEVKKLNDISDQIAKIQGDLADKRAQLSAKSIDDELVRELEFARLAKEKRVDAVQSEIDAAKKLKDVSAEQKKQKIAALTETLRFEQSLSNEENAVRGKFAQAEVQRLRDRYAQERALTIKQIQDRTALLETAAAELNLTELERQKELKAERLNLILQQRDADIKAAVEANAEVAKLRKQLDAAVLENNESQAAILRQQLGKAQQEAYKTDPAVKAIVFKAGQDYAKTRAEGDDSIARVQVNAIADISTRAKELAILDAKKALSERLKLVRGNAAQELEAWEEYYLKLGQAEEDYLTASSAAFRASQQIRATFAQAFSTDAILKQKEQGEQAKQQYADEEKALFDSLKKKEISYEQYTAKLAELQKKQDEIGKKSIDVMKVAQKAFADSLAASAKEALSRVESAQKKLQALYRAKDETAEKSAKSIAKTGEQEGQAAIDLSVKVQSAQEKTDAAVTASLADTGAARMDLYKAVAETAVLSFGQMVAEGQKASDAMLVVLIDAGLKILEAQVPLWITGIIGNSLGSFGPIAGVILSTAAIATLTAAAGAAKAALLGANDGVVGIDRRYNVRPSKKDTIPVLLRDGESVLTPEATAANRSALVWANKTGKPLSDYYVNQNGALELRLAEMKVLNERYEREREQWRVESREIRELTERVEIHIRTEKQYEREQRDNREVVTALREQTEELKKDNEMMRRFFREQDRREQLKPKREPKVVVKVQSSNHNWS